jgi:hypothetical protein
MGIVLCERHGRQTGPFVCGHIGGDAHGVAGSENVSPDSVLRLELDLLEDGGWLFETFVCRACAGKYGLANAKTIPADMIEDEERFPVVAPACEKCLAAWREHA